MLFTLKIDLYSKYVFLFKYKILNSYIVYRFYSIYDNCAVGTDIEY